MEVQPALGLNGSDIDGPYGKITANTTREFQATSGLTASGEVDSDTWQARVDWPICAILDRTLELTAVFEGNGFMLAQGNFADAGITRGIGFTLVGWELGTLLKAIDRCSPSISTRNGGLCDEAARQIRNASTEHPIERERDLGTIVAIPLARHWGVREFMFTISSSQAV